MNSFLNYMLRRTVFANTIMVLIIIGGLLSAMTIRQELLPVQEARTVEVSIGLTGASPDEINSTILLPIENEVRGLNGIKHVDGNATEGNGTISVSLLENADMQQVLNDIKTSVDKIETFPEDADKPVITIPSHVEKALSIVIYGDQPLKWLQQTAETVRDDLRTIADLKKVEIAFPRDKEIVVEVSEKTLRQHGLTLKDITEKINENSPNLPGGTLITKNADIALRTFQPRENPADFSNIVIKQTDSGIPVRLSKIAELKDGFGETPVECWFNGHPAIQIDVFAVGNESPL
ncbi:MAG: efflux RND transporter permease subunit, partial [Desulfobacterales bacterium]|nr:efflux RND transporter permease subunit [Desulfobacterales bacterium]